MDLSQRTVVGESLPQSPGDQDEHDTDGEAHEQPGVLAVVAEDLGRSDSSQRTDAEKKVLGPGHVKRMGASFSQMFLMFS